VQTKQEVRATSMFLLEVWWHESCICVRTAVKCFVPCPPCVHDSPAVRANVDASMRCRARRSLPLTIKPAAVHNIISCEQVVVKPEFSVAPAPEVVVKPHFVVRAMSRLRSSIIATHVVLQYFSRRCQQLR
jgi:hypothetical protein